MRVNTNGLYVLAKKVTEHLGVSYADINAFVYPARHVLSGDLTIDEALEHIPYESHARYDLIGALEAFDQVHTVYRGAFRYDNTYRDIYLIVPRPHSRGRGRLRPRTQRI
mgnify:CR=1 FL=1